MDYGWIIWEKTGGKKTKKALMDRWKNDPIWKHKWEQIALWLISASEEFDKTEGMEYTSDGYLDLRGFPLNWDIDIQDYTDLSKIDLTQNSRGAGKYRK